MVHIAFIVLIKRRQVVETTLHFVVTLIVEKHDLDQIHLVELVIFICCLSYFQIV